MKHIDIKVEKRDKKIEDYDPEKILKVLAVTGLTPDESKKLVAAVNNWLERFGRPKVTSLQIRDRVLVEIQKINRSAANKFIWYEKYKDKNEGVNY